MTRTTRAWHLQRVENKMGKKGRMAARELRWPFLQPLGGCDNELFEQV